MLQTTKKGKKQLTVYQRALTLNFTPCVFFPSPFAWLCSRQTPLLPAIRCVRRIWCSEIAVCESMPLPVQTSSEGLKNGMGEKNQNKMMIAGPWLFSTPSALF